MSAPNDNGTNNPQTVTGGQFGVIIDGSPLNQAGVPAGTQVNGPIVFDSPTVTISGDVIANSFTGNFIGNITNINVANSVAGANVIGPVAFATVANSVAGANVTGAVAFATTANSVAGANVVGEVAFAAVANSVDGSNVVGIVANAAYANVAGTVANAIQSNITTIGTLTQLDISGPVNGYLVPLSSDFYDIGSPSNAWRNVYVSNVAAPANGNISIVGTRVALGSNSNVKITGGTAGQFLQTTGNGNLIWSAGSSGNGTVGGSNTQIQFNDSGNFGGVAGFTFDSVSGNVDVPGNVSAVGNVTAGYFIGNGSQLTDVSAPNANYANFAGTAFSVDAANVVGNVAVANLALSVFGANVSGAVANADYANIAGIAYSVDAANIVGNVAFANVAEFVSNATQSNITAVGTLTSLSVSGNVDAGNLSTAGNVTAGYFIGNGSSLTGLPTPSIIANGNSNVTISSANGPVAVNVPNATDPTQNNLLQLNTNGSLTFENPVSTQASIFNGSSFRTNSRGGGWAFSRGRGTKAAPLSLQPNDEVGQLFFSPHNGTTVGTDGASIRALVDPSYVANQSVVPVNWRIGSAANVGNVPTYNFSWFYANTQFTPAGNIVTIANSDHNLGNSVTANYFIGDGSLLSNLNIGNATVANANYANFAGTAFSVDAANVVGNVAVANLALSVSGANVSGEVAFAAVANSVAGANVSGQVSNALVAGTVYTNAQPNITSVGILTSVSVSGNADVGNIGTAGLISATGNVTGNFFIGNGSQLTGLPASSIIANGNSNVSIPVANGNVTISAIGVANVVQINGTTVTIANTLTAANLRTTGDRIILGNGAGAGGTQPDSIAIGRSASATSSNAISIGASATASGGQHAVCIGAGTAVDGGLGVAIGGPSTGMVGGSRVVAIGQETYSIGLQRQILLGSNITSTNFNSAIVFNALANTLSPPAANSFTVKPVRQVSTANVLYYDESSGEITFQSTGNITSIGTLSTLSVSGNANIGNIGTAGLITATGNISGGNLSGTLITGTLATANQPNITNVGTLSSLSVSGTANIANLALLKFNETVITGNVTGTITPDVATGSIFNYTLTGNITMDSLSNVVAGTSSTLILKQDATGNRTLTSTMKFAGGVNTLSTTANAIDVMGVFYDGSTYYASLTKGYV